MESYRFLFGAEKAYLYYVYIYIYLYTVLIIFHMNVVVISIMLNSASLWRCTSLQVAYMIQEITRNWMDDSGIVRVTGI